MAKRTVGKSAVRGVLSSENRVAGASLCHSSADDREDFEVHPAVALPSDEEANSTKASPEEAPGAPLSWPFLCPLCSAVELVDPVDLHAPARGILSPSSLDSESVDEAFHCLACRVCVKHWLSASCAVEKNKAEAIERADNISGTAAEVTCSPLSVAASTCVPLLACPLCNAVCDTSILPSLDSIGGVAGFRDAHAVRNIYTGSLPPLSASKVGYTVSPPGAPTASPSPFCSVCEEERATCVCVQCDFGMCDACHKATHTKGGFRQHEVMNFEQARRRGHYRCTEHAGMALDLFCDTCSACVCVTCCFGGAHRGHDVSPLTDVVARTAAALTQCSTELAALQLDADATHARFAALWPAYETKVDGVRTEIQHCFASLRQVLHQREDALLTRLNEVSTEVGRRSSELRSAMHAVGNLLGGTSECMRRLPEAVSPATLMRIFDTVQRQQEWVFRVSARVLEEATGFAEGWSCNMSSDDASGCRMASFVLLNATTPNDDSLRQYERVLSDLGRLDASADVQLRLSERPSMASLETAEGHSERVEEKDEPPRWEGIADDFTVPSDGLRNGTVVDCGRDTYPTTGGVAIVEEGKEEELARPSHIATATPSLPLPVASSKSREVSVASRDMELCVSRQRSMSASTVQSQFRPLHVSSITAPKQSTYGPLRTHERNVEFSVKGTGAVTSSSAAATMAAGTARLHGPTSRWGDLKRERREVGDRGHFAAELGSLGCHTLECVAEARGVRETMPFRVSLSPRRIESYDCTDENDQYAGEDDDQLPWRAFKLHRNSSATGNTRSAATSLSRHGSSARLQYLTELDLRKPGEIALAAHDSSLSAPKLDRGETHRRTTGLQLEL